MWLWRLAMDLLIKNIKYFDVDVASFYQVSKVLMSALTDGIISPKMFNFGIYIESYARTLGQYFHSQQSQQKDVAGWNFSYSRKITVLYFFCLLKSIAFWSSQLQWRLPVRNEILLSRRNNKMIARDLCTTSQCLTLVKLYSPMPFDIVRKVVLEYFTSEEFHSVHF